MRTEVKKSEYIQLDATRNIDGKVTITPSDEDRFGLRVGEVIEACQRARADEQARGRFDLLLKRLGTWVLSRNDIRSAFITTRDGSLCFVVVHDTPAYDRAFEDALSDLDLEIAGDSDIPFALDVVSLPPVSDQSLRSFLSATTLEFRGHS